MPVESEDSNTIEVVNISSDVMRFEIDGLRYRLGPRERATIHKNYALPRRMQNGRDPVPSTIENLTNHKVLPITDKRVRKALGL